jgi:hypothetical protein
MDKKLKKQLEDIAGAAAVFDGLDLRKQYAADQSFVSGSTPDIVVRPRRVEEIQAIVRLANRVSIPLTPFSSGLNLHGAALASRGGIMLDLTGMDKIIEVNEKDWYAVIEPGVTYEALQNAATDKGLRLMAPFGVPPRRSVLSSYVERDVMLAAAHLEYGNYLTQDTELILPDGELLRTGCWNLGGKPGGMYGPGLNKLYKLWTGAQGTLGVLVKMIVSVQHLSAQRRFFFMPFDSSRKIPEAIKQIQRKEIGWECFALNRFNLAAILNDEWEIPRQFPAAKKTSAQFETLQKSLPAWTIILGISGSPYFPEERVAYEEEALKQLCREMGTPVDSKLPGFPDIEKVFLRESLRPWGVLKKFNYKGSVHDLSFKVPLHKFSEFEALIADIAALANYPLQDIGGYAVVLERGRAMHCEFDLHCEPDGAAAQAGIKNLWLAASKALLDKGALFDRPYGDWAPMVYARAPEYALKLKQIKQEMDPQGILNPGKLCF